MRLRIEANIVFEYDAPEEAMRALRAMNFPIDSLEHYPVLREMLIDGLRRDMEKVALATLVRSPDIKSWEIGQISLLP